MRRQPVAIHQKLVPLRLTAKDGMVVEHEASLALARLPLKNQSRSQPADAAANHNQIKSFPSLDHARSRPFKQPVANLMTRFENGAGIPVRVRVIANPAVARPTLIR